MYFSLARRRYIMLWQLLLLLLGTSWLWAAHLNPALSSRTALISQYEASFQPYSWLFRLGDLLAGLLVIFMATIFMRENKRPLSWLLLILGIGMAVDPLIATTCHQIGSTCQEYVSLPFVLHAIETTITSATFFIVAVYDAWQRKKLVSIVFAIFQAGYGLLFISQLANQQRFNTFSQIVYQSSLIVWLAWFGRDYLINTKFQLKKHELRVVKNLAAVWAFLNGILAILVSLAHIHLLGKIKGLYFAGDSAWLAQHGVIIGVIMIYLSRHLARGELRARQIFLAITGIEAIKYSVISPNPWLLTLYLLTFCALFMFRDDFDRGVIPITWQLRLRDLYFMIGALLLAAFLVLLSLDRDSRAAVITGRAFDNFFDYVVRSDIAARSHLRSALLAHTITAFITASASVILWILFRPYKTGPAGVSDNLQVKVAIESYSNSSEDYFKLWPKDKAYFWSQQADGFIAYKIVGPVVFALADPISKNKSSLAEQFIQWSKERRLKVCFLPVYENNVSLYKDLDLELIQIGSSAVVNINNFLTNTASDKWWRWQKNRAVKSGYIYERSLPPHQPGLLVKLKAVSDAWLTKSGHTERSFALGYFDKDYLNHCQLHYLREANGNLIAFTNQLPQFNQSSIVTIDLLRHFPEANNAMPYLLYKTIETTATDAIGYRFFDLGFVPFAKAKGPVLAIAKAISTGKFSAHGLEQFKNKFDPNWQPNYLAYDGDLGDLATIALHLEKAMES